MHSVELKSLVDPASINRVLVGTHWIGVKKGTFRVLEVAAETWCRWEEDLEANAVNHLCCPFQAISAIQS